MHNFERLTLAASGLTLAVAIAAWGLMRLGAFSLGGVAGVALLLTLGVVVLARRYSEPRLQVSSSERWQSVTALALCVGFGLLYAWYPTYFLSGGQDPGVNLALAARIAKSGGLELEVPAIEVWARSHSSSLLGGFPGIYGNLADPHGRFPLQAQFLHFFTAFDAAFFSARGVEGAVRANAWLATLCLATGFAWLRRIRSPLAGFLFVALLGLNPAFIWASRITLTEMLALWLNLSGLFLLALAWDRSSVVVAAAAGAYFGIGVLNRLDGGFGSLAVLGFAAASLIGARGRERAAMAAASGHLVVSVLAYRDAYVLSPIYCQAVAEDMRAIRLLPYMTSGLDVLAAALAWFGIRRGRALQLGEPLLRLAREAILLFGTLWVLYGIVVRPTVQQGEGVAAFRELSWYMGWLVWPLLILGVALSLRAVAVERWLPLVAFTIGSLAIYTSRTEVAPFHIWASRRWVPHTIPLTLACAALAVDWLHERIASRRLAAGAVAVAMAALGLLVPAVDFDRVFLFQRMFDGLPQRYDRLVAYARQHTDRWPLLSHNVVFASVLTYVYDVPTVPLSAAGVDALDRGDLAGSIGVGFHPFALHNEPAHAGYYLGRYLESVEGRRPERLVPLPLPFEAGEVGGRLFEVDLPAAHPSLHSQSTLSGSDGSVVSSGNAEQLLFGPSIELGPGRYRIEWRGRVESVPSNVPHGLLEVTREFAKATLPVASAPLVVRHTERERVLGALDFLLVERARDVEFRMRVNREVVIALTKLRLSRVDEP